MKIALYFGSFNPIHIGHLIIAQHVLNATDVKKLWFVVSPQNPEKPSLSLLKDRHRLHLVRIAIEDEPCFKASDVEFNLSRPSYTIHTLAHLKDKYPQHEFCIVMGADSFQNVLNWKNGENILYNNTIYVYQRDGFVNTSPLKNIHFLQAPLLNISASIIRTLIKEKKSIQYLVHQKVKEEILQQGYYTSPLQ